MLKFISSKLNSNKSSNKNVKSTKSTKLIPIQSTQLTNENLKKIQQIQQIQQEQNNLTISHNKNTLNTINFYKNKNINHIERTESVSNFDDINSACSSNCENCKNSQTNKSNQSTSSVKSVDFVDFVDLIKSVDLVKPIKPIKPVESSETIIERYFVENFLIMIILFSIGFLLQSYNQYINNIDMFSLILQFDLLFVFFFNTNTKQIDISCQLFETNLNILKISNFLFGICVKGLFTRLNLHEFVNIYLMSIMIVFLERLFFNYYVIWFIHGKI